MQWITYMSSSYKEDYIVEKSNRIYPIIKMFHAMDYIYEFYKICQKTIGWKHMIALTWYIYILTQQNNDTIYVINKLFQVRKLMVMAQAMLQHSTFMHSIGQD